MEINLKRNQPFTKGYTAGRLFIDGVFSMFTLEDEVREVEGVPVAQWKVKGETAIPRGRYRVILTRSPKFGRILPEVLNVPGYSAIRMHAGNKVSDTEGCLMVGLDDGNPQDGWLGNSRKAEGVLLAKLNEAVNCGQQIWLTVGVIMAAIKLFLGQYGMFIAGAIALALGIYVGALKYELGSAQGQLEKANGIVARQSGEILKWQSAYDILARKTAEQNAAVENLKAAEITAQARRSEANKKAGAIAEARAGQINLAGTHPASGSDCAAAVEVAKQDLRGEL